MAGRARRATRRRFLSPDRRGDWSPALAGPATARAASTRNLEDRRGGTEFINNATHTIIFQGAKPSYNPGLITNSFLLLPYGMVTLLVATGRFTPLDWALSLVIGIGVAAMLGYKTRGRLARLKDSPN